jgi:hypothetical protein
MEGFTYYECRKDLEVLWDISGSCNIIPLLLDLLISQLHYACKRVRREHRHKLVVSRTRVVTTFGIAAFQGKIARDRTHRPRPPLNHTSKRLQNTSPIPLDPMRNDILIKRRLR